MTEVPDLDALAASVRKSLHWCVFLLGAMALILVIDLQIKRAIGRQAVNTAKHLAGLDAMLTVEADRLIADARARFGDERGTVDTSADDADHPRGGSGGDVDGSPRVSAGDGEAVSAPKAKAPSRRGRAAQRAPGDG